MTSHDGDSRIANVSAVLFAGLEAERTEVFVRSLEALFEEVLVVPALAAANGHGARAPLEALASALAAAREERVLVVSAEARRPTPRLWLALSAWPEHDVVTPRAALDATPQCALYRRDSVLPRLRDRLSAAQGEGDSARTGDNPGLAAVLAELDADVIAGDDLAALGEDDT